MTTFRKNDRGELIIDHTEAGLEDFRSFMEGFDQGYREKARRRQQQVLEKGFSD